MDALEGEMEQLKAGVEERYSGVEGKLSAIENRFENFEEMMKKVLEMQSKALSAIPRGKHEERRSRRTVMNWRVSSIKDRHVGPLWWADWVISKGGQQEGSKLTLLGGYMGMGRGGLEKGVVGGSHGIFKAD
ncbi:hypothetical protein IEQ34_000718 [Dendrobium chrysotoxum]|uniref:Uncharacterized protein n=1 Tax=Dendrobium chrysotoxum TaxID=161865 RepID=A0AAV7HS25_DENCH|nr:hypothetical protein IEQ34_000718 [Dendrobium chrysotoxum]